MGGPGKTIDTAMFTPSVRIDRMFERNVGRVVAGDDMPAIVFGDRGF